MLAAPSSTGWAGDEPDRAGQPGQQSPFGPPRSSDAGALADPDPALMSTAQRHQIVKVLRQAKGNKAAAAKQLGISRRSLYRWLDRLDIPQ